MNDVEVRCECSKRPILGIMRWTGKWVFHIRVYKQKRTYAELIIEEGTIRLRCRECERWYVLRIRKEREMPKPTQESLPDEIKIPRLL